MMSQDTAAVVSPRKVVIQMSGAPGSGKSTTSKSLQQTLGGLVIDHDIIRSSLLEDDDLTFDQAAKHAYRLQWAIAEQAVSQGHNVFIDSPCNYQQIIDHGRALAEKYGMDYWYIECQVEDLDLLDARLKARTAMKSQRTAVDSPPANAARDRAGVDPQTQVLNWMKSPCRPDRNVIAVDSTSSPEKRQAYILDRILSRDDAGSATAAKE